MPYRYIPALRWYIYGKYFLSDLLSTTLFFSLSLSPSIFLSLALIPSRSLFCIHYDSVSWYFLYPFFIYWAKLNTLNRDLYLLRRILLCIVYTLQVILKVTHKYEFNFINMREEYFGNPLIFKENIKLSYFSILIIIIYYFFTLFKRF